MLGQDIHVLRRGEATAVWRWAALPVLLGLLALSACAGEKEAGLAPTTAAPAGQPAWQQEWARVLEAAKKARLH